MMFVTGRMFIIRMHFTKTIVLIDTSLFLSSGHHRGSCPMT